MKNVKCNIVMLIPVSMQHVKDVSTCISVLCRPKCMLWMQHEKKVFFCKVVYCISVLQTRGLRFKL